MARPGYWNKKTITDELKSICEQLGRFPTHKDCANIGRINIISAIQLHGFTLREFRIACGFDAEVVGAELPEPTSHQMEIINGGLLGDGYLSKVSSSGMSNFKKNQASYRKEYLDWHMTVLSPFSSNITTRYSDKIIGTVNGKIVHDAKQKTPSFEFYTARTPFFGLLRNKWYPKGIKEVPKDLNLSPLLLAIWMCDDGTNYYPQKQIKMYTNGFSVIDAEFLVHKLYENLNFKSTINLFKKKQPIIVISRKCYFDFIDLIGPYITFECMSHKTKLREPVKFKINNQDKIDIFNLAASGMNYGDIAFKFNISRSYVCNIYVKGKNENLLFK